MERLFPLFPSSVSLAVSEPGTETPLWPEEENSVRHAVISRRLEFAAGRAAARAALVGLGAPEAAIPVNPDRTPAWPSGFVGSITHCQGFCGAVAARARDLAGIGFDAEPAGPLPEGVDRMIYAEKEAAHFSALPAPAGLAWPKLAFSAKEAFYKCFFPLTRTPLHFREVRVHFAADGGFEIESEKVASFLSGAVEGRWLMQDGLVFTSFVKHL